MVKTIYAVGDIPPPPPIRQDVLIVRGKYAEAASGSGPSAHRARRIMSSLRLAHLWNAAQGI